MSCGLETLADAALGLIAPASTLKDRMFWLGSDERQTFNTQERAKASDKTHGPARKLSTTQLKSPLRSLVILRGHEANMKAAGLFTRSLTLGNGTVWKPYNGCITLRA